LKFNRKIFEMASQEVNTDLLVIYFIFLGNTT